MSDETTTQVETAPAAPTTGEDPRARKNRLERERRARKAATVPEASSKRAATSKAVETDTAIGASLREASVCVLIDVGKLGVRRSVASNDVTVEAKAKDAEDPDPDMVIVGKDIIDSPELREIATFDHYTKLWVRSRSVPSPLLKHSAFLFGVDALSAAYEYLEDRAVKRDALVQKFEKRYPALVADAKKRLGGLFDPTQYPPAKTITSKFRFTWQVVEMGVPGEKLRTISRALFEKEREKHTERWTNAVGQVEEILLTGMQKVVSHLAEQLAGGADGKKKRVTDAAVKHMTEFLDALPGRNLTSNTQLQKLADDTRKLLNGVDVKDLRKNEALKSQMAADFEKVKAGLGKMLEERPSRSIVLSSKEAL